MSFISNIKSGLSLALIAALAAAAPAVAQFSASDGPVNVTSDGSRVETDSASGLETLYLDGKVELLQNGRRLRCDHAKVIQAPRAGGQGGKEVVQMEATGNVFYVVADETVRGDYAIYTKADDTLKVTGDVILVRGRNVATGTLLVDKVHAGQMTLTADSSHNQGRVKSVLYPHSDQPQQLQLQQQQQQQQQQQSAKKKK